MRNGRKFFFFKKYIYKLVTDVTLYIYKKFYTIDLITYILDGDKLFLIGIPSLTIKEIKLISFSHLEFT